MSRTKGLMKDKFRLTTISEVVFIKARRPLCRRTCQGVGFLEYFQSLLFSPQGVHDHN